MPRPGRPRKSRDCPGNVDVVSELYKPLRVVGSSRLYKTADELAAKINEFVEQCMYESRVPVLNRLVSYLELRSTASFYNYRNYGDDYAEIVDKTMLLFEAWLQEHLIGHRTKSSTIGIIFTLKNLYGWVDSTQSKNETTLEIMPRESLVAELEHRLSRITDARSEAVLVEQAIDAATDSTRV